MHCACVRTFFENPAGYLTANAIHPLYIYIYKEHLASCSHLNLFKVHRKEQRQIFVSFRFYVGGSCYMSFVKYIRFLVYVFSYSAEASLLGDFTLYIYRSSWTYLILKTDLNDYIVKLNYYELKVILILYT